MKVKVVTIDNKSTEEVSLNKEIFACAERVDLIRRVINWQLAKRQAGTHKTKQRSEVTGTTKKPFRQKGTGNARQGSLKGPHMRGGGVAFGPVVRSHAHKLPKKIRALALRSVVATKNTQGSLIILDDTSCTDNKTSVLSKKIKALGVNSALFVGDEFSDSFKLATRNIPHIDVLPVVGLNVYDIVKHKHLVIAKSAIEKLEGRLA